jgi:hypothetical protein
MADMNDAELARWYRLSGNWEVWEDIASWFQHDTGHLRPGKDKPAGWHMPDIGEPDCCMDAWIKWSDQKRGEAVRGMISQRDRYREALEEIRDQSQDRADEAAGIARRALK